MKATRAALGFRVKSGWAVSILLGGSIRAPELRESRVILLSDPRDPKTKQPHHAAMGKLETNAARLKQRAQKVHRAAAKTVAELLKEHKKKGRTIRHAGLVVGSQINPDLIANPHIRAHALEGRLFKVTLQSALQSHGIRCAIFTERDAYPTAANLLGLSLEQTKRTVSDLARSQNGPWRADQKMAALAAWVALR